MKHPRLAHVAKICAIVAVPLGLLLGMMLSAGQDLAGAGMIRGLMFIAGVGVSLLALLVYLVASVDLRVPRIPWPTIRRNQGKIVITAVLFLVPVAALYLIPGSAPQSYALGVSHEYADEIAEVRIRIGADERFFSDIAPSTERREYDLGTRPASVEVEWRDPEGSLHTVTTRVSGNVPERYHNGLLRVSIRNGDDVRVRFQQPR